MASALTNLKSQSPNYYQYHQYAQQNKQLSGSGTQVKDAGVEECLKGSVSEAQKKQINAPVPQSRSISQQSRGSRSGSADAGFKPGSTKCARNNSLETNSGQNHSQAQQHQQIHRRQSLFAFFNYNYSSEQSTALDAHEGDQQQTDRRHQVHEGIKNSRRPSDTTNIQQGTEHINGESSSYSMASSLWAIKGQFLSGLSSRLEAALHMNSTDDEEGSQDSDFRDQSGRKSSQNGDRLSVSSVKNLTTCRKMKDRSVFGQPEVPSTSASVCKSPIYKSKEHSMDSLDTIDSGRNSMGSAMRSASSSCHTIALELNQLEQHDPLKPYRPTDSLGIGSGQCTSIETSEADDEDEEAEETTFLRKNQESHESLQSWISKFSDEEDEDQNEDEQNKAAKNFMKKFVEKIFDDSSSISLAEKAEFGNYCRTETGRLWFARFINEQRCNSKMVSESTFYSLIQHFAIVLFECADADDFVPARTLMNMSFTYYHGLSSTNSKASQSFQNNEYLYIYLKDQPIWKSGRFWNAAFFDSVQRQRSQFRPTPTVSQMSDFSDDDFADEVRFQENVTFGQLATYTHNMMQFGLPKQLIMQFLNKQATINNLPKGMVLVLQDNIDRFFEHQNPPIHR